MGGFPVPGGWFSLASGSGSFEVASAVNGAVEPLSVSCGPLAAASAAPAPSDPPQ
jgi:hypothetical protein